MRSLKKLVNHKAAVALYVAHYNLCRVHEALRTTAPGTIGAPRSAPKLPSRRRPNSKTCPTRVSARRGRRECAVQARLRHPCLHRKVYIGKSISRSLWTLGPSERHDGLHHSD